MFRIDVVKILFIIASMKLFKLRCQTNLRKNIFSNRVDLWNDVDQDIINIINVDSFKSKLDNLLKRRWFTPANRVLCTLLATWHNTKYF